MIYLNYAIAGGDKTLLNIQSINKPVIFQVWYQNLVATTAQIEVWVSTDRDSLYSKIDQATKILLPMVDGTCLIPLSGLGSAFVQFRLVAPAGTAGVLTKLECMVGSKSEY